MTDDHRLLRRFAEEGDEAAFTELVGRHLGMVHGICRRRTGDSQLAEELAQNVFAALARKAGSIRDGVLVVGWLHRASCLESLRALRAEASRQRTMKRFKELQPTPDCHGEDLPSEIVPLLDEAMDRLASSDRDVLLMRFASGLTLRQIGEAMGKSESASQRHLQRAVEKLSGLLRKRGVTVGVTVLAGFLGTDLAKAAPATLASATVSKVAIAQASAGGAFATTTLTTTLILMKQKATIVAAVCLLAAAGSAVYIQQNSSKPESIASDGAPPARVDLGATAAAATDEQRGFAAGGLGERKGAAYPELVDRFGQSRVNLAKNTTGNLIAVAEAMARMAELAGSLGYQEDGMSDNDSRETLQGMYDTLSLREEQRSEMDQLLAKQRERMMQSLRDAPSELRANRKQLMELLLAGDAVTRGELSADEHAVLLARTSEHLAFLADESDDEIASVFGDEEALRGILDDEQMGLLGQVRERLEKEGEEVSSDDSDPGMNLGSLSEPKNLEELDNEVFKAKSVVDGLMQMFDALSEE